AVQWGVACGMSAPLANEDRTDDPLIYAPRRARCSPPLAPEPMAPRSAQTQSSSVGGSVTGQPEAEFADSPPMAPGIGGPNLDLPLPRLRPFAGDVAVRDLRHRLALHPELTPEPPRPAQRPA